MSKNSKRLLSILMTLLLLSVGLSAFAADASVTFEAGNLVVFRLGSVVTDNLFGSFTGVMPGDVLTDDITITNSSGAAGKVRVYMKALPHDAEGNVPTVMGELTADTRRGTTDEISYMNDFLSQLNLKVENSGSVIYIDSPDKPSMLAAGVLLGTLANGESLSLDLTLTVPAELDNAYAGRIGEVDWVFTVEGEEPTSLTVKKVWVDEDGKGRPESVDMKLLNDGVEVETVTLTEDMGWEYTWDNLDGEGLWTVEEVRPWGYTPYYEVEENLVTVTNTSILIQTGQVNWPIYVFGALGICLVVFGFIVLSKRKREQRA